MTTIPSVEERGLRRARCGCGASGLSAPAVLRWLACARREGTPVLRLILTLRGLGAVVLSALLAGCASTAAHRYTLTGDPLVDGPVAISNGPPRDKVLWQYRMAAAAMQRGQWDDARRVLDEALARIGGIYSADKDSRKARSYFAAEAKKTFLGEPYERVMAYYYRGVLYWMQGEPDNARACFRSGQFHDGDAEEKTYASDYVLLDYLDGLATVKLNGDGSDAFKRAREACKLAIPPDANAKANVLFFVDFGLGPTKFATGEYGEELRFRPGVSEAREVMIRIASQAAHVGPYDDLNFQATTRGGRVMDHILGNKAVFKSTTDTIGNIGLVSGAVLATQRDTEAVGLGLLAAGLFSKIVSASTRPEADTRCWDNLPLYLTFASFELPAGQYAAEVEFLDANRRPISRLTKNVTLDLPAGAGDKVVYVSDKSITPQTL